MEKSFGWAGRLLWIDLSDGTVNKVPIIDYKPEEIIGGVGLNARIFWKLGCPQVSAYDPENPLIISGGPLTGIYGFFGRGEICSISPQCYPDELFTYSGFGGMFPSMMKYAGYDGIVILGKANKPVYLSIHDEDVQIKDAADLWGRNTFEAQQALLDKEPEATALVIGPAGENLSRIAVILNETECAAGQGGFGAVMGSKNLKAIAIKGTGVITIAESDRLMEMTKIIIEENKKNTLGPALELLTMNQEIKKNTLGAVFRTPWMSPQGTKDVFAKKYYKKPYGCYGCPQQCRGVHEIPGIGISGASCVNWLWGPLYSFTAGDIWETNVFCQRLGINTFEVIFGIPFILRRSFEAGVLTSKEIQEDIDLPTPQWLGGSATNHEFLTTLLNKIANGEGPYAEGTARFAEYFGQKLMSPEKLTELYKEQSPARGYAVHFTENLGCVLHWATDTRDPLNSCHDYIGTPPDYSKEAMQHFGLPTYDTYQIMDLSKTLYRGVERVTAWVQDNQCLKNSLPICEFFSFPTNFYHLPEMDIRIFESELLSAVTGIDIDTGRLAKAGERIVNLLRAIMVKREKRTREGDNLPEPYFKKVIKLGPRGNGPIDKVEFEGLKDRYYELRGWDVNTGWPTRTKLEELGLKTVADELEEINRLPSHKPR